MKSKHLNHVKKRRKWYHAISLLSNPLPHTAASALWSLGTDHWSLWSQLQRLSGETPTVGEADLQQSSCAEYIHVCTYTQLPSLQHFSFKFTRGRSWDEHAQRMRGCCSSSVTSSSIRVLLTLCIYNATSTHLIRLRIYMPFLSFKTPLHFWSRPVRLWSSCISELNSSCQ